LLALRKINPTEYGKLSPAFRVGVLVDALKHAKTFNAWGLPNSHWHEAAEALIDEKDAARPALVPLLKTTNSRFAPMVGMRSRDVNEKFHYRESDYALALLNEINGEKEQLPPEPARRNILIDNLAHRNGLPKSGPPVPHQPATHMPVHPSP
jgi:hypothetical protein